MINKCLPNEISDSQAHCFHKREGKGRKAGPPTQSKCKDPWGPCRRYSSLLLAQRPAQTNWLQGTDGKTAFNKPRRNEVTLPHSSLVLPERENTDLREQGASFPSRFQPESPRPLLTGDPWYWEMEVFQATQPTLLFSSSLPSVLATPKWKITGKSGLGRVPGAGSSLELQEKRSQDGPKIREGISYGKDGEGGHNIPSHIHSYTKAKPQSWASRHTHSDLSQACLESLHQV